MMIAFRLFYIFFKIGLFCFGGGYAMIAVIKQDMLSYGFLTAIEYDNIVAISQITPGAIAINTATFVGVRIGEGSLQSLAYAAVAAIAVSLPSFILIMIVAKLFTSFSESNAVKSVMSGIRPSIIGLIINAAIGFGRSSFLSMDIINSGNILGSIKFGAVLIAAAALVLSVKTKFNPIWILLGSGIAGLFVLR